jgi:hypothetical protein
MAQEGRSRRSKASTPVAPTATPLPDDAPSVVVTVRIPAAAHEELRTMAFVERRTKASYIVEGLNHVLRQRGKPLIPVP